MDLINNTKTTFVTSEGPFGIGKVIDFKEEEANTLLKYDGIEKVASLKIKKKVEEVVEEKKEEVSEEAPEVKKTSKKK